MLFALFWVLVSTVAPRSSSASFPPLNFVPFLPLLIAGLLLADAPIWILLYPMLSLLVLSLYYMFGNGIESVPFPPHPPSLLPLT